jgi:hypothetical protein
MKRTAIRARIDIPSTMWIRKMPIFCGSALGIASSLKNPTHNMATIRTASIQCSDTSNV